MKTCDYVIEMMRSGEDNIEIHNLDESLVYQELSDIRTAFEALIERYGYDSIEEVMSKVVTVLEQFEALAAYKRQARLRLANAELILEEEKESRNNQELQASFQIKELQEQSRLVTEENYKLKKQLNSLKSLQKQDTTNNSAVSVPDDSYSEVMTKLNDVIHAQQTKLTELREEYEEINQHSARQSSLIIKLKSALQETCHAQKVLQTRNDSLCNELARLEAELASLELQRCPVPGDTQDHHRSDSCTQSDDRSWDSFEDLKSRNDPIPEDKDVMKARNQYRRSATQVIRDTLATYSPTNNRRKSNKCTCDQHGFKFSVDEMTLLINERNILKEKLISTEEDLAFYKEHTEIENEDVITEEGFAILDPPATTTGYTRTLFKQMSRDH